MMEDELEEEVYAMVKEEVEVVVVRRRKRRW